MLLYSFNYYTTPQGRNERERKTMTTHGQNITTSNDTLYATTVRYERVKRKKKLEKTQGRPYYHTLTVKTSFEGLLSPNGVTTARIPARRSRR